MSKYTAGPWRVTPPGVYTSGVNIDAPKGYVALVGGGISDAIMRDAHLIAAAPDLLEALERVMGLYDGAVEVETLPEIIAARAAIAKARGEA